MHFKKLIFTCLFIGLSTILFAQSPRGIIQKYLEKQQNELGLTEQDISEWSITDQNTSPKSGVQFVYIRQQYKGINISSGVANFAIKDGRVVYMGNRLITHLKEKVQENTPSINPEQAILAAARQLGLEPPAGLRVQQAINSHHFVYNPGDISQENIPVELMYHLVGDEGLKLVWDLSIYTLDSEHWWSVRLDAASGELIDKIDWVVHCNFDHPDGDVCNHNLDQADEVEGLDNISRIQQPDQYTVFAIPVESPSHGNRSLVTNPADATASPFGWHDTNGNAGAEYTITRGNNVFAYEDVSDNDAPGFSPDGLNVLEFNFPYNGANAPSTYQSAAITNLFYMNNIMHDVWYQYGFDEAAGNFQTNNYGNGGTAGDEVRAEAQDGGGNNNANFATPPDGSNGRMQMYLWNSGSGAGNFLTVNSPGGIAGGYSSTGATFGPGLPATPITADVVLGVDGTNPVNDCCEPITNGSALINKIALIDRGSCTFVSKVLAAQNEGALAVIIVNNVAGAPIQMGGTNASITIPSIMISQADGNLIKAQLSNGVNATISNGGGSNNIKDGDLDNGIVAHEYGHGISIRMTGGPNTSNCLSNAEQMGEGWSDWFGLMLTIEPGDSSVKSRGIGTYAAGQPTSGTGIRPAPYTTDFGLNNFTYGSSNNTGTISQPHGIGFVFATALWDMNWALIDFYGGTPDANVYSGTGGNNVAMALVIEGLRLQPCNPGMIDGRDAILMADSLLYNGAHQCIIWEAFAKRGFGFSASQGSSNSRTDQTEAFDLPSICLTPVQAPTAAFSANSFTSCTPTVSFTDNSTDIPQAWSWDFGDGNTSTAQNPTHTYSSTGTFSVTLTASNSIGSNSITQTVTITLPPAPTANDLEVCSGATANIQATASGTPQWYDSGNNPIFYGNPLVVPNVTSSQTFYLENWVGPGPQTIGPGLSTIGGGGYHNSGYHGAINFSASKSFEIVSAWVDADGAGQRTISLASGTNTNGNAPGNPISQVTVNLANGVQQVNLNLTVPAAGNYNLGGNNVDLFRNSGGANYPYTVAGGLMTLNSSSATTSSTGYYYYFYDIEIREPACISPPDTVTVSPIISNFTSSNNNGTVTFTDNSTGATSWSWDFGDGNSSTQQNPVHTYAQAGPYTVTLTINNGACGSSQTLTPFVGTDLEISLPQISLIPNPTEGISSLVMDAAFGEDLEILLTDLNGRTLKTAGLRTGETRLELDLSQYSAGVYFVRIRGKAFTEVRKLMLR